MMGVRAEAMLQYFNTSWKELTGKIPEIAEAGYESLWLPPPAKAGGGLSVGYDVFDRFDLGSKDQRGSVSTRYGTEADLKELIRTAHRFGIRVYLDNIMNHNGFDTPLFTPGTPTDLYPGFIAEDFHLRVQGDGTHRKWDNTRNWGDEWQVLNLGLSDLIDIAQEPGGTNRNYGPNEGDTGSKPKFVRHPDHPEYYCYMPPVPPAPGETHANQDGTYVGFGPGNGITTATIAAYPEFFEEYVDEMLSRAARWTLDRTKVDGFRLDAVKHAPFDFFGDTAPSTKDTSDYGYTGQIQRQFNLTRGFDDPNHRNSVFDNGAIRNDAMLFGEHLGEPPSYGGYINAGMRLIDNPLRNNLNNILGNPSASLFGYDSPGVGGFGPGVSVMHAQSHDNDFAALREIQHAFYFTRDGLPLVYTDGNYHAGILEGSGGAFPRHANTAFLGQFADDRLPNLAYIHQHFARGVQEGRWGDNDFLAYERLDKRENASMPDTDAVVATVMLNDNTAAGAGRSFFTKFPSTPFVDDAYLYQYARGYGSQVGFYKYASQLDEVIVDPGSYLVFSYRTPEESNAWKELGGRPIEIFQGAVAAGTMTVTRRDGPDGDGGFQGPGANPGFHPYSSDISNPAGDDFEYEVTIPRITDASNVSFVFRTDSSSANILAKLDGGIDLNGAGSGDPALRDNPPGASIDMFLGYEQPSFVERMGPEKFAGTNTGADNALGSTGAGYWQRIPGGSVTASPGSEANTFPPDTVFFVYHDPAALLPVSIGSGPQFQESGSAVDVHVKTNVVTDGDYEAVLYYTTDGVTEPQGIGGMPGNPETAAMVMADVGNAPDGGDGTWWKATLSPVPAGTIRYKMGVRRTSKAGNAFEPVFPSGQVEVDAKLQGMTVFEVAGFDGTTVEYFPHNDLATTPDGLTDLVETGLEEGFHMIRARAFLKRDGKASLYNTFQQTFYFDANRPSGEIVFPAENDTVGGQSYEGVVRADASTTEVWFYVDDGVGPNDDDTTGASNGNGPGKWVRAAEVGPDPNISSAHPKEFRFNYVNIAPGGVPAKIHLRLVEATSSDPSTWSAVPDPSDADDDGGWFTTLTRNVTAEGLATEMFVVFPANDGDTVDDNYTLKAFFSKGIATGLTEPELIDEFDVTIASVQSGSPDGAVLWDSTLYSISYNETADYHALAFDVPNLYNRRPDFLHTITVTHERAGVTLEATRLVKAAVQALPYAAFVIPPLQSGDGQPHIEYLPDIYPPDLVPADREIAVQVETDGDVQQVDVLFAFGSGTIVFDSVQTVGSQKLWNYVWTGAEPGSYRLRANIRKAIGGPLVAVALRDVTVELGPAVPVTQDNDADALPDWWEIAKGLDPNDNGTGDVNNGASGDPDGDGRTNFEEFLAGLDPLVPDAYGFPQLTISRNPDGTVNLSFPGLADRLYRIYWSPDLSPGSWLPFGADIDTTGMADGTILRTDGGPPQTPTSPVVEPFRFYYLEVDLP